MVGVNKVILLGNLGDKPIIKYTADGKAIATLSVATSKAWVDKQSGEKKEITQWHRVSLFGKLAEIADKYCLLSLKFNFLHLDQLQLVHHQQL
jgi:single-strand DNA-binding protein